MTGDDRESHEQTGRNNAGKAAHKNAPSMDWVGEKYRHALDLPTISIDREVTGREFASGIVGELGARQAKLVV